MNPNVKVSAIPAPGATDVDTLTQFDMVICVNTSLETATQVNETCRKRREEKSHGVKRGPASEPAQTQFMYVFCRGLQGLWFADWGCFTFHDKTYVTHHYHHPHQIINSSLPHSCLICSYLYHSPYSHYSLTHPFTPHTHSAETSHTHNSVPLAASLASIPLQSSTTTATATTTTATDLASTDIDFSALATTVRARSGRLAIKYTEQVCRELQVLARGAVPREIAPVCAVLGGVVAQEILRVRNLDLLAYAHVLLGGHTVSHVSCFPPAYLRPLQSVAHDEVPMGGSNWGILNAGESSAVTALIE